MAASRTEGEETQRRASLEGRSRGGEGAPEGKSRGEEAAERRTRRGECAPEGRSLGGGAGHAVCSGGAGHAGCSAAPGRTRGMTHGMPLFHLAVMQQHYKENIVLNTTTCNQVAWW